MFADVSAVKSGVLADDCLGFERPASVWVFSRCSFLSTVQNMHIRLIKASVLPLDLCE